MYGYEIRLSLSILSLDIRRANAGITLFTPNIQKPLIVNQNNRFSFLIPVQYKIFP